MKRVIILLLITVLIASCNDRRSEQKTSTASLTEDVPGGAVIIARDIVTEVIIRPDPEGDPWEIEKVAGYNGEAMVNSIFERVYDGTLTVYDYHSGEALTAKDVKKIEAEFNNDRTKIGKLSFTEDWYYSPAANTLEKKARSVVFGYELYNNLGKVYAYRAAFRADLGK
jgi:hypothetical protein